LFFFKDNVTSLSPRYAQKKLLYDTAKSQANKAHEHTWNTSDHTKWHSRYVSKSTCRLEYHALATP
jgi:hypothetical protein